MNDGDQPDMSKEKSSKRLPRREFLANLLFATGALTVASLQSEVDLVALQEPKDPDWTFEDDKPKKPKEGDGWDLPDDLLDSPPQPKPKPQPKPRPQPPLPGRVSPPQMKGAMEAPERPSGIKRKSN